MINVTIHDYFFVWVKSFIDIYVVRTPAKPTDRTSAAVILIEFQWFVELGPGRRSFVGISDCYWGIDEDGLFVK